MSDFEKLHELCSEADALIENNKAHSSYEFQSWHKKCLIFLSNKYGKDSMELKSFWDIKFNNINYSEYNNLVKCHDGIKTAKGIFESLLKDMNDISAANKSFSNNEVFIVHGHDDNLKNSVARLLEQQNIKPIILHEQDNIGDTIIEKVQHYGNSVGAAIILFTPDDLGKERTESKYKTRARQNVIFEAGYFLGCLGRDRIIPIVTDKNIELPGDLNGIVYISDMWQFKVTKELKAMGFDIDMNKIVM